MIDGGSKRKSPNEGCTKYAALQKKPTCLMFVHSLSHIAIPKLEFYCVDFAGFSGAGTTTVTRATESEGNGKRRQEEGKMEGPV